MRFQAFATVHLSHGSGFFHFDILSHEPTSKPSSKPCLSVLPSSRLEGDGQKSQRDFLLSPKCRGRVTIRATDLCFPARLTFLEDSSKSRRIGPSFDDRVVSIVGLGSLRLYAPSQLELLSRVSASCSACFFKCNVLSISVWVYHAIVAQNINNYRSVILQVSFSIFMLTKSHFLLICCRHCFRHMLMFALLTRKGMCFLLSL